MAKIKCSICSYQFNIWYAGHSPAHILIWFLAFGQGSEVYLTLTTGCLGVALQSSAAHSHTNNWTLCLPLAVARTSVHPYACTYTRVPCIFRSLKGIFINHKYYIVLRSRDFKFRLIELHTYLTGKLSSITEEFLPEWGPRIALRLGWPLRLLQVLVTRPYNFW